MKMKKQIVIGAVAIMCLAASACGSQGAAAPVDGDPLVFVDAEYAGDMDEGTVVTDVTDFDVALHYKSGKTRGRTLDDDCRLVNPAKLSADEDQEFEISCNGVSGKTKVRALEPVDKRIASAVSVCRDVATGSRTLVLGPENTRDGTMHIIGMTGRVDADTWACVIEQMHATDEVDKVVSTTEQTGKAEKYQMEDSGAYYYWEINDEGQFCQLFVAGERYDYGLEYTTAE